MLSLIGSHLLKPRFPLGDAAQSGNSSRDRLSLFIDNLGDLLEMGRLAKMHLKRRINRLAALWMIR